LRSFSFFLKQSPLPPGETTSKESYHDGLFQITCEWQQVRGLVVQQEAHQHQEAEQAIKDGLVIFIILGVTRSDKKPVIQKIWQLS